MLHRLKGGGFRLRLKAGSVRLRRTLVDSCHVEVVARIRRRVVLYVFGSWPLLATQQHLAPKVLIPLALVQDPSPMPPKGVGFPDPLSGTLNAVPYLKKFGVTPENLIYKFDFKGARFIYLWSGKYDYRSPSGWDSDRPKYADQMKQLQRWLDEAKAESIKKAFITFHYPTFARSGLGAIPAPDNPHKVISAYANDMEVIVFNGHVHTTELFDVDNVKYLMLGGGGAEQDPILPGRTSIKLPAG